MNNFKYIFFICGLPACRLGRKLAACSFLFFMAINLQAENNQDLIKKANELYQKNQYQEALQFYKKVLDTKQEAPELYYNIGNVYFKTGNIPSAILYFEKAKKLDPGNTEINNNIAIANMKSVDKIDVLPQFILQRWLNNIVDLFSIDAWAKIIIVSFVLLLIFVSFYIFTRSVAVKKTSFIIALILFTTTASSFVFAQIQYNQINNNKEAIIFAPSITIKSSPSETSTDLFILHEGTKVKVIDKVGEWNEIKLPNGSVGWLKENTIEII